MTTLPALLLAAAGVGFGHAVMPDHWLPLAVLSRTRAYRTPRVLRLSLTAAFAHVLVSLALGAVLVVVGLQFRATVASHTDLVVGLLLLATGAVFLVLDLLGKGHGHSHDGEGHHHGHGHDHGNDHARGHAHAPHGSGHIHAHGDHEHVHEGEEAAAQHTHAFPATALLERPHEHEHPHEHGHAHEEGHEHTHEGARKRSPRGLAGLLIPFGAAASPDLTILPVFLAAGALGVGAALGTLVAFTVATVATIAGLTVATALGARMLTAPWIDKRANLITALTLLLIGGLVAGGVI